MAFYERRLRPFDWFRAENLEFFPHTHGHVELIRVREGEIALAIGQSVRILSPGEMAIVFPNTVHSYKSERQSACELLIFDTELVSEYAPQLTRSLPAEPFLAAHQVHRDVQLAIRALRHAQQPSPLWHGYLLILVGRVLEQLTLERRPAPPNVDLLHRLLMYLDEHFREPLSLEGIGAQLGASRYQISRCFSQQIGCNFNSYVNALRTAYAAGLLRHGGLSIAEVGYESGFDSMSTFYRAFKRDQQLSPKAYQAKNHEI